MSCRYIYVVCVLWSDYLGISSPRRFTESRLVKLKQEYVVIVVVVVVIMIIIVCPMQCIEFDRI